jgi:hypothetical protein
MKFLPVYDFGSCEFPQIRDNATVSPTLRDPKPSETNNRSNVKWDALFLCSGCPRKKNL